jgi:uncharacterized protein with GYD domain
MPTFILLSKIAPTAAPQMTDLAEMDRKFERGLADEVPEVVRKASYALLGPYDFMHIIEAPDAVAAAKVALMVNRFGVGSTQTLTAIPFEAFAEGGKSAGTVEVAHR